MVSINLLCSSTTAGNLHLHAKICFSPAKDPVHVPDVALRIPSVPAAGEEEAGREIGAVLGGPESGADRETGGDLETEAVHPKKEEFIRVPVGPREAPRVHKR